MYKARPQSRTAHPAIPARVRVSRAFLRKNAFYRHNSLIRNGLTLAASG